MKKLIVMAAAIAVAIIGFGGFQATTTHANPGSVWVVNEHVVNASSAAADCATAGACDLTDPADRAVLASSLDEIQTQSAGQTALTAAIPFAGSTWILVETDGSGTAVTLNGRGLTCTPACDAVATATPDATDHMVAYEVTDTGTHSSGDTLAATAQQDAVTVDSETITVVGQAHDLQLVVLKPTIQEGATSCDVTDSISAPTRSGAAGIFSDINGTALVGYYASWSSSSTSVVDVAEPVTPSMLLSDGSTIAAGNVICGDGAGSATLSVKNTVASAISGETTVTRTEDITVTGVPASIALTASPATIACDGSATSTVTAKVTDADGNDVVDNTNVNFSVVALGTANPINEKTTSGEASSTITPLSGSTAGVTVIVTSGDAQASIRVDCTQPVPTVPAATPTATGGGVIVGPNTGTGGYLGQDGSAGFPMWTLVALVLGSLVLVGGGMVTRRAGK